MSGATAMTLPDPRGFGDRLHRWARQPRASLWIPLAVYAVSRLVTWVIVELTQRDQIALYTDHPEVAIFYERPPHPGYLATLTNWDGQWYEFIARNGYPDILPREPSGDVMMNPWAFFPLYPFTCRAVMSVTGLDWVVVGPTLAILAGALACLLLFRLVDMAVGRFEAVACVVALCFHMTSPVLSASYTESFALVLVLTALHLLRRRRYAWFAVVAVGIALTRNVVIVLAPVVAVHAIMRCRTGTVPAERRRRYVVSMSLLGIWCAALTWLWPALVDTFTGTQGAYAETLKPWGIDALAIKVFSWFGNANEVVPGLGPLLLLALLVAYGWFMFSSRAWAWGPEIWAWGGSYAAYMLLAMKTNPSILRYSILLFPCGLIVAWALQHPRLRRWRVPLLGLVAVVGVGLMTVWFDLFFIIRDTNPDITYP